MKDITLHQPVIAFLKSIASAQTQSAFSVTQNDFSCDKPQLMD
jgi:hypothetical protein